MIVDPRGRIIRSGFLPSDLVGGVVSSWFRLAAGTITGSGYSSVPDILDAASPATQGTDARRPPAAVSANGFPIVTVASHALVIPVTAARYGTTKWGFWGWFRRNTGADNLSSASAVSGSSVDRLFMGYVSTNYRALVVSPDGSQTRAADVPSGTINTWKFMTVEYNADFAGDLAMCMTVDGTPIVPTFSGALGAIPATLRAVTGNSSFGAISAAGSLPFVGSIGGNWGFLGGAMAGVTTGLLTPAARTQLMNFEAPT